MKKEFTEKDMRDFGNYVLLQALRIKRKNITSLLVHGNTLLENWNWLRHCEKTKP